MSQTVATQKPASESNANKAAISSPKELTKLDILDYVRSEATRQAKGITRERYSLNQSKLFSAVCARVKSQQGMDKSGRVSQEMADLITECICEVATQYINAVTPDNVVSMRKSFAHKQRSMAVVERVTVVGENTLALKEQLLGIHLIINAKKKRLNDLMSKPTPDYDRETSLKEEIAQCELTEQHIKATIALTEQKS